MEVKHTKGMDQWRKAFRDGYENPKEECHFKRQDMRTAFMLGQKTRANGRPLPAWYNETESEKEIATIPVRKLGNMNEISDAIEKFANDRRTNKDAK